MSDAVAIKPRILVIEDTIPILENLVEALEMEDYDVVGVSGGKAGIDAAYDDPPDMILCDIMMPEVDGYQVLLKVQKDSRLSGVPFIFLTAKGSREDVRRGMNMGADDYLSKPFSTRELLDMVRSRLKVKSIREQEYERQIDTLRTSVMHTLPHELRTPLTGILGYSAMLIEDLDVLEREQISSMLKAINRSGERLFRLVENYLLYAQLEVLRQDAVKLAQMRGFEGHIAQAGLEETAAQRADFFNRRHNLDAEFVNATLAIDANDLRRTVYELVDNAFKFSPPDTNVVVRGQVTGTHYQISVQDSGRGMTVEQIEQIAANVQFERRVYEQQGTGLGLAIVKYLVEIYNGTFSIESTPGKNTCITIQIPLYAAS
ncbi:MAG: response regulator [Anaerolineales bacterium]